MVSLLNAYTGKSIWELLLMAPDYDYASVHFLLSFSVSTFGANPVLVFRTSTAGEAPGDTGCGIQQDWPRLVPIDN